MATTTCEALLKHKLGPGRGPRVEAPAAELLITTTLRLGNADLFARRDDAEVTKDRFDDADDAGLMAWFFIGERRRRDYNGGKSEGNTNSTELRSKTHESLLFGVA